MSATPAYLGSLSWPDVDPQRSLLLAVPLGSCEQHGPHLPLDTDTRIAVALADRLAARRAQVVVAPAVAFGSSGEHAGFPGTLSIGQEALELVLVELCRSADVFAGVVIVNGHGGNAAPVARAVGTLTAEGRRVLPWWPSVAGGDAHAGRTETSIVLALDPDAVRLDRAGAGQHRTALGAAPHAAPRRCAGGGGQRGARRPDRRLGGRGPGHARRPLGRPGRRRRRLADTMTRFRLDPGARRLDGGRVLLAGSPLRLFRLTAGGATVVDAIEGDEQVTLTGSTGRLLDRLLDAGAVHPRPTGSSWATRDDVTVVIPTFGADVGAVVEALRGTVAEIVVVDDGSFSPIAIPAAARLVRRAVNGGPGAARNTGLAEVTTPLVAFVDADTTPTPSWLEPLLAHFDDARVGLVAPRVTAPDPGPGATVVDRYDTARSPLDLGPTEARVRARTRVSYVPAAAMVVRTAAIREIGGFDEDLRVGEDVDLVWRLDEAGWRCRYEPGATVTHAVRPRLRAWVAQRVGYGHSAALLAERHPGALAPAAVSAWSAGAWALALTGHPVAGAGLTFGAVALLARKLRALERPWPVALRLAGLGTLAAGRQLAEATTRAWWPAAAGLALVSRRARKGLALATIGPALLTWAARRPPLDPIRFTALYALDDAAYGVGVWQGALAARTAAPLLPDLTSWPSPARYERRPAGRTP